jgi:hypothetical protein
MTTITFDPAAFRLAIPAFANSVCFSDATLLANFDTACAYVSPSGGCYCSPWTDAQLALALNYMTGHITKTNQAILDDEPLEIVKAGSISKVRVEIVPPPGADSDSLTYWLSLTPYGRALLALLALVTAGGFYFGGLPERSAFRRVGGGFGGRLGPGC